MSVSLPADFHKGVDATYRRESDRRCCYILRALMEASMTYLDLSTTSYRDRSDMGRSKSFNAKRGGKPLHVIIRG